MCFPVFIFLQVLALILCSLFFFFFCFISMFEVGLGGGMDEYWMVRMVF